MKTKNKKAELPMSVIITILILIASAAVIFLFYYHFSIGAEKYVYDSVCEQSVNLRSEERFSLKPGQLFGIPLRCKTAELIIDSTYEQEIKEELANALYDCWRMLGKGEKNFFSQDLSGKTYCVLCSTIEFNDNVKEKINEIRNLDQYLVETKVPGSEESYATFLTTEKSPQMIKDTSEVIDTSQKYVITYAMAERSTVGRWIGTVGGGIVGVLVGSSIGGPVGAVVGGTILAGVGNVGANKVQDFVDGTNSEYYVAMEMVPFGAKALQDFGCTSIESIP